MKSFVLLFLAAFAVASPTFANERPTTLTCTSPTANLTMNLSANIPSVSVTSTKLERTYGADVVPLVHDVKIVVSFGSESLQWYGNELFVLMHPLNYDSVLNVVVKFDEAYSSAEVLGF